MQITRKEMNIYYSNSRLKQTKTTFQRKMLLKTQRKTKSIWRKALKNTEKIEVEFLICAGIQTKWVIFIHRKKLLYFQIN